jgi:hypothetical protein
VADHRHKRDTEARRKPRAATVAAPLALLATAAAVGVGVLSSNPDPGTPIATRDAAGTTAATATEREGVSRAESRLDSRRERLERRELRERIERRERQERQQRLERQQAIALKERTAATRVAVRRAETRMWTTTDLNLWLGSSPDAAQDGLIESGERVLVTGRKASDRVEIVVGGQSRWVTAGYLSDEKPVAEPAGLSMAACPQPGVESGLTESAVRVYRAVCNAFPQITSYGGWDGHGEHASGRALDIMTSDVALGTAIADFLRAHAGELNLYDVIWRQRIWTQERGGEGWRAMSSRGSATADHYDHVHVATY